MTTTNKRRAICFLVSAMTVIAALVFLRTLVVATLYSPDSISYSSPSSPIGMHVLGTANASDIPSGNDASSTALTDNGPAKIAKVIERQMATDPLRLSIPSLKINAAVQLVGVKPNGNLSSPNNFVDVGWYAAGTIPGDIGSAVFDGHVDNGLALSGVFKHLSDIGIGDNVIITDRGGAILHFIVTDVESYDYMNAPADMIFNQNNGIFIKLITCGGTWVPHDRTYDRRIVVTAVLVK